MTCLPGSPPRSLYHHETGWKLFQGDSFEIMRKMPAASVDLLIADPPYFLSNGGTTCSGGKRVAVDKGEWDRLAGRSMQLYGDCFTWNRAWLADAQRLLKPTGSIIVCGNKDNIFDVGVAMKVLEYRVLNQIVWEKPAPPPNLGCRTLTHSHETLLWASLGKKYKHFFAYSTMRELNEGKQLKDVWRIGAPKTYEKRYGKHPAQKTEELLERAVMMACPRGGVVLDPFNGSGTTGVAALRVGCRYVGIDLDPQWLEVTKQRMLDVAAEASAPQGGGNRERPDADGETEETPVGWQGEELGDPMVCPVEGCSELQRNCPSGLVCRNVHGFGDRNDRDTE